MKLERAEKRKRQKEPGSPQRSKFTRACSGATTSKYRYKGSPLRASVARQGVNCKIECSWRYDFSKCLVDLYNKAERSKQSPVNGNEKIIQGIALAQVVAHIEETRAETRGSAPTVFRLAELTDMYSSYLAQLGLEVSGRVHSTDFKERLLTIVPGLQANKKG